MLCEIDGKPLHLRCQMILRQHMHRIFHRIRRHHLRVISPSIGTLEIPLQEYLRTNLQHGVPCTFPKDFDNTHSALAVSMAG